MCTFPLHTSALLFCITQLGLIFYKYLSDKLLEKVVVSADASLEEYDTQKCILQYKCGSYAMLVNDEERPPGGGRSFFWNISVQNSDRDFDKAPEF